MDRFIVRIDEPEALDVRALLHEHLAFANRHSPPEDVHALDVTGLLAADVSFFSVREDGVLVGVGALKQIDEEHAEVKSMHTAAAARRRGAGQVMLDHLIAVARSRGCRRLSLETGSMRAFAPARALYSSRGFEACDPFVGYGPSPYSAYMTLDLTEPSPA